MKQFHVYFFAVCYLAFSSLVSLTAAPAILEQHDENSVLEIIQNEVPGLYIDTIKLISAGWDNLVADVNDVWIFRFPQSDAFISILEREIKLLDLLQQHLTMPVPHYEYFGVQTAFVGYRKISGVALDEMTYLTFSEEDRQQTAEALALFFSQLHNAVNINKALQWGYNVYHPQVNWIKHDLLGTISSKEADRLIREALAYYQEHLFLRESFVFLHFDLHGENLAIDTFTHKVNGVFDFSDAVIGDYSVDFSKLYCIHSDLAIRTAEVYAHLTGRDNPALPGAADYILRRALYILNSREDGDTARESRLIRSLERFASVWDNLRRSSN